VPVAEASSWEHVAAWYDDLIEERGSDHHENVIIPNTLRLLGMKSGETVLDVACGQGVLCRKLAGLGVSSVGVDAAPSLISAAKRLSERSPNSNASIDYRVSDARDLGSLGVANLDAATCIMAMMNINPLEPVMTGIAGALREGGRCVVVVLHPAFRSPGQTSWGWDGAEATPSSKPAQRKKSSAPKLAQFRRVDGYLSPGVRDIVMNPGAAAKGHTPVVTQTFHRSIQAYVKGFAAAGLLVNALEEWPSARQSEPGPRAAEENRARREIPMFLAIRGVKVH
jgi:ubiquinone/menaquinone biosynthesis C-methylase UbiE